MRAEPQTGTETEPQLDPIAGYLELGMEEEALQIARSKLSAAKLTAEEFGSAVYAILQASRPARWRKHIERALANLPPVERTSARGVMLRYFFTIGDTPEALLHVPSSCELPDEDLFFAMRIFVELGMRTAAAEAGARCRQALQKPQDDDQKALLIEALGSYYAWSGNWPEAVKVWAEVPITSPFLPEALCGLAHIHTAQALLALRFGMAHVKWLQKNAPSQADRETAQRLGRQLLRKQRLLEKAIPAAEQEFLGLNGDGAQFVDEEDGSNRQFT